MRHDDPWIFGMLWEVEHREEPGRLARGRLARHAAASKVPPPSEPEAQRGRKSIGQLLSDLTAVARLRLRRSPAKLS